MLEFFHQLCGSSARFELAVSTVLARDVYARDHPDRNIGRLAVVLCPLCSISQLDVDSRAWARHKVFTCESCAHKFVLPKRVLFSVASPLAPYFPVVVGYPSPRVSFNKLPTV